MTSRLQSPSRASSIGLRAHSAGLMSRVLISIGAIQLLIMFVALVRAKVLSVLLGPSGFGVVSTIDQATLTAMQLAHLSLPFTALKFMSRRHSDGHDAFERTYASFFRALLWVALLAVIVLEAPALVAAWRLRRRAGRVSAVFRHRVPRHPVADAQRAADQCACRGAARCGGCAREPRHRRGGRHGRDRRRDARWLRRTVRRRAWCRPSRRRRGSSGICAARCGSASRRPVRDFVTSFGRARRSWATRCTSTSRSALISWRCSSRASSCSMRSARRRRACCRRCSASPSPSAPS